MDKRIHIITGHYGSGKSEIAVNLALKFRNEGRKLVFADLDIINPYFRSNEARHFLENNGITVITTKYANTNVDIPALTGELSAFLHDRNNMLILDVGGDDAGAKVVGRYRDEIADNDKCLYFVINCFRPETRTVDGVLQILDEIVSSSRMKVDFLINNSHLMNATTPGDIQTGKEFTMEVSRKTGIPIAFHSVMGANRNKIKTDFQEPVFLLEKYMGYWGI